MIGIIDKKHNFADQSEKIAEAMFSLIEKSHNLKLRPLSPPKQKGKEACIAEELLKIIDSPPKVFDYEDDTSLTGDDSLSYDLE